MDINIVLTLLSAVAGAVVSFLCSQYFANRKKSIHKKLQELDFHLEYISKLRKSSIELHRKAYSSIFSVLSLISIGLWSSVLGKYISPEGSLDRLMLVLQTIFYLVSVIISCRELIVYSDVSNYQKAVQRIEQRKVKLAEKLMQI
jgi:hypothetical protein